MSYVSPFTGDVIQPTDVSYQNFSITEDLVLAWPVNGNVDGNYAARIMDVTATAGGLSLYMPPANQVSVGTDSLITNKGSNTFTVTDSAGGTIVSIDPGKSWYVFVTNNGSEAGTWSTLAFGVGTSYADAAALQGAGLTTLAGKLATTQNVADITSNPTLNDASRATIFNWGAGAGTFNLALDYALTLNDDDIIRTSEGLVFNPYNPSNVEITLSEVQSILTKYGLPGTINNLKLYQRAFVHRSYTKRPQFENVLQNITIVERPEDCMPLRTKSNERLEFLGDGVLELITKYYLYRRFPKENEKFMTEKKIAIVKNEAIGKIALEMGLHKWLILSKHAEEKKIRTNLKKLGCLFEAFLGALFLDFNKIVVKDEEGWFQSMFVTGPGLPSPVTHVPHLDFAEPIGETTAAVPHAKVSVISPDSIPAFQSSTESMTSSTS